MLISCYFVSLLPLKHSSAVASSFSLTTDGCVFQRRRDIVAHFCPTPQPRPLRLRDCPGCGGRPVSTKLVQGCGKEGTLPCSATALGLCYTTLGLRTRVVEQQAAAPQTHPTPPEGVRRRLRQCRVSLR